MGALLRASASGVALAPAAVCCWLGREGAGLAGGTNAASRSLGPPEGTPGMGMKAEDGTVAVIHRSEIINDLQNKPQLISASSPSQE